MSYFDLREYLEALENAGELHRVSAEVDPHLEMGAVAQRLAERGGPAVHFQSLKGAANGVGRKLNVYGRLGERIKHEWYIHILEDLDENSLATDHEYAQSLDIEQSLWSSEKFKESRYRKPKKE